jgi:hypothetical protein
MAITVENFGPDDGLPLPGMNEYQYLRLVGDGTSVLIPAGAGLLHSVWVGVAGTLATFYDTPSGGTADGTTACLNVATSVTGLRFKGPIKVSKGLTVVTTGSNGDLCIVFYGRPTVQAAPTFGV